MCLETHYKNVDNEISSSSDEVFITKKQLADLHMKNLIKLTSYKEVMNSWQCDYWIAVMQAEINELIRIEVWKLVKLSKKQKVIKKY